MAKKKLQKCEGDIVKAGGVNWGLLQKIAQSEEGSEGK